MMTNRASVLSKTKIVDLTRTVCASMPMFPGSEKPKLAAIASCSKDGFSETLLTLSSHTGTHMDAPAHVFAGRATLDALPAAMFAGKALVIDCSDLKEGSRVTMEQVARKGHLAEKADFLLFRTGWDKRWGKKSYFGDYPCIDEEVADFRIRQPQKGARRRRDGR
jgi:kynurenine formamidase